MLWGDLKIVSLEFFRSKVNKNRFFTHSAFKSATILEKEFKKSDSGNSDFYFWLETQRKKWVYTINLLFIPKIGKKSPNRKEI